MLASMLKSMTISAVQYCGWKDSDYDDPFPPGEFKHNKSSNKKIIVGTPEVRSDKSLTLLTFDIQPIHQWTNGPMVQWYNGPMAQGSNGPMDQRTNVPIYQWTNGLMYQCTNGPMVQWSNSPIARALSPPPHKLTCI